MVLMALARRWALSFAKAIFEFAGRRGTFAHDEILGRQIGVNAGIATIALAFAAGGGFGAAQPPEAKP